MYESSFHLTGLPFPPCPDSSFLFERDGSHKEALVALRDGFAQGAQVMVVTGEAGVGKTTLLQTFLAGLDSGSVRTVSVSGQHASSERLVEALLAATGAALAPDVRHRRDALLGRFCSSRCPTLVAIDDAQHLAADAFELLESMATAVSAASSRLQICLVGEPSLERILDEPGQLSFGQRIGVRQRLRSLDSGQTLSYIEHRLRIAGWMGDPQFDEEAVAEIFRLTSGVPRRLDLLFSSLLTSAFEEHQRRVDASAVRRAASALDAEFAGRDQPEASPAADSAPAVDGDAAASSDEIAARFSHLRERREAARRRRALVLSGASLAVFALASIGYFTFYRDAVGPSFSRIDLGNVRPDPGIGPHPAAPGVDSAQSLAAGNPRATSVPASEPSASAAPAAAVEPAAPADTGIADGSATELSPAVVDTTSAEQAAAPAPKAPETTIAESAQRNRPASRIRGREPGKPLPRAPPPADSTRTVPAAGAARGPCTGPAEVLGLCATLRQP